MLLTGETACDAIREIHKEYPDFLVGAGNITEKEQVKQVVQAGTKWIACAGIQENLVRWCRDNEAEIVPGVSTASEIETAIACGLTCSPHRHRAVLQRCVPLPRRIPRCAFSYRVELTAITCMNSSADPTCWPLWGLHRIREQPERQKLGAGRDRDCICGQASAWF